MPKGNAPGATIAELRVLDGPNVFFPRPAVQLTLGVPWYLDATEERMQSVADRLGVPGGPARSRPGPPGSDRRLRFTARVAAHVARRMAEATHTHLAVRARPGPEAGQIVVAFPWRRRTAAEAFAGEVAAMLDAAPRSRRGLNGLLEEPARTLAAAEGGEAPSVPDPTIPVIAVTGTNGKTTTVRLLAHIARTAGLVEAHSCTDGVYRNEVLVEEGDYSGFAGAGKALEQPGAQVAILETARGGILLRGIGAMHNDVALVTNVSADHLGLRGIRTLDQLAEVKSTILRITRPEGWAVLNADDPRVLDMRRVATGRPWLFSLDPDHPGLRSALEQGGRATTVIDGRITNLAQGHEPHSLISLEDVPVTIAGVSTNNVQNALSATAAALGAGIPERAVVKGLKTFVLDPERNPGRTNLFELDGRVVVVDYAHNEAGMRGLVEVCGGLRRPGAEVWLTFDCAGDRTDEILHGLGYLAARGADHLGIAELRRYLRGRDPAELTRRLQAGIVDGGAPEAPVYEDEVAALRAMLAGSKPGDIVAITALGQRREIFGMLDAAGATRPTPSRVRQLVRRARRSAGQTARGAGASARRRAG
jgi:cyanophycin synthetase